MAENKTKNNIYLFYGEDDFSLRRKLDIWKAEFAKKFTAQAITFLDAAELTEGDLLKELQNHLAPSLFTSKKLIIIRDGLPKKADQEKLAAFLMDLPMSAPQDFFIVFWQSTKPDGRLKFTKQFSSLVNVQEFNLPQGTQLNAWLKAMAKTMGSDMSDAAAEKLAVALGRDLAEEKKFGGRVVERKEAFDLWQAFTELQKLTSNSLNIGPELVTGLVKAKIPDSVFALTEKLSAGNQAGAFQALENFMASSSTDEKGSFIKIVGLLSEQIRSLLNVSVLKQEGLDNEAIAEKLGYTSGRVFIVSKNAQNFRIETLRELLGQLLKIDLALKSTDANPALLVDLFIVGTARNLR
jgi:DNA polymerase III delta subunit